MNKVISSFTNTEDGMTAMVVTSDRGGYAVCVRDDDSGEFIGYSVHGIMSLEDANNMAEKAANL
jgi:adenine deaminase